MIPCGHGVTLAALPAHEDLVGSDGAVVSVLPSKDQLEFRQDAAGGVAPMVVLDREDGNAPASVKRPRAHHLKLVALHIERHIVDRRLARVVSLEQVARGQRRHLHLPRMRDYLGAVVERVREAAQANSARPLRQTWH